MTYTAVLYLKHLRNQRILRKKSFSLLGCTVDRHSLMLMHIDDVQRVISLLQKRLMCIIVFVWKRWKRKKTSTGK